MMHKQDGLLRFLPCALAVALWACGSSNDTDLPPAANGPDAATNRFWPARLQEISDALGRAAVRTKDYIASPVAIVPNIWDPYWTATEIGAGKAATETGCPVSFVAPFRDSASTDMGEKQREILRSLVSQGYRGVSLSVAVSASDPTATDRLIGDAMSAAANPAQFITIDSDAPESSRVLYMGTNNVNAGREAGVAMTTLLGGAGQVIIFTGSETAENARQRIQGVEQSFAGTNVKVVAIVSDHEAPSDADAVIAKALTDYPDVSGIVTIWGYNGPAAARAVTNANAVSKIQIVAFDLATETQDALRAGVVGAAIGQRPYWMGYLSVYVLQSILTIGAESTKNVLSAWLEGERKDALDTGVDVITPSALQSYLEYLHELGTLPD